MEVSFRLFNRPLTDSTNYAKLEILSGKVLLQCDARVVRTVHLIENSFDRKFIWSKIYLIEIHLIEIHLIELLQAELPRQEKGSNFFSVLCGTQRYYEFNISWLVLSRIYFSDERFNIKWDQLKNQQTQVFSYLMNKYALKLSSLIVIRYYFSQIKLHIKDQHDARHLTMKNMWLQ